MDPVLYGVAAVILAVLIFFITKVRGQAEQDRQQQRDVSAAVAGRARPLVVEERGAGMPRRRRNLGSRVMAQRRAQRAEEQEDEEEHEVDEEEEQFTEYQTAAKIGAKKQRKLEEKQARKAQREAEQEEREERKRADQQRDEERRREEEKNRLEEQHREVEERRAKEEAERQEQEEYLRLKEQFSVEEEGLQEDMTEEESHNLLQEFINHIKAAKVVLLEDLASHFGLRTQDAINRLQDLIADGTLTGVIDDRGKFIFITPEELSAVAQFIKQRGRVSITELAQASNSLINLTPETSAAPQVKA
ncbi:DDRGK domain-containing protein 1-like isoform X2 [Polyodon spathula]|uniref:DDRGK domain-containing protein 1-like isoform X2 n=1 Tax=Polyodon spathula TaxID=7913 RepID=UPI001B7E0A1F|nr:DDRGK domain-containing protein 1-like isoform X2 [Polyodon spathula]